MFSIPENAKVYAEIFTSIERLPQLTKYYHKCQKEVLSKKWRASLENDADESVNQWMHNFYDLLVSNWHAQTKWFHQVFADQSSTDCLVDIYIDVLTSMDPSFNECIDAALKQTVDRLGLLREIKEITLQFCCSLNNVLRQTLQGNYIFMAVSNI